MTKRQVARWLLCGLSTIWLGGTVTTTQSRPSAPSPFIARNPEEIGSSGATLFGDPSKPGLYVMEAHFAPGRGSRPHFHDQDRLVTVIKGTWWVALGPQADAYDPNSLIPMKAGSFVYHPAFGHHWDTAKDEDVVVRIVGMGPVKSTQLTQPK